MEKYYYRSSFLPPASKKMPIESASRTLKAPKKQTM
jgi:hypothetical protein